MSEMKTLKFPGDAEPREIVDAKAREDVSALSEEKVNQSALSLGFGTDGKLYIMVSGVPTGNGVEINGSVGPSDGVVVFEADFSGSAPSSDQFYSWEGRIYDNGIYDALHNIQCANGVAMLTSVYDSSNSRWIKQMMCTGGLFEADNFVCKFRAKFCGKPGSWNNVITYGTGTHWANGIYSDGVKWPSGGEIDTFEQAGGYAEVPNYMKTPTAHWGSGSESGYTNTHEWKSGNTVEFTTDEWHDFKFSLNSGYVKVWIDDVLVGENDFSDCIVSNNYMADYAPFLKPQAFYIDGSCASGAGAIDTSNVYKLEVSDFKIIQDAYVECTGLEIFPQMWERGTELVFPVGAELYLDRVYTPANTSNKACQWESSNTAVATVVQGYVKILSAGTATITATCGNATAQYVLTAAEEASVPCAKIEASPQSVVSVVGQKVNLEVYRYPAFTTEVFSAESSNEGVCKVNGTEVTMEGVGEATVTIRCGSASTEVLFTVNAAKTPYISYDFTQLKSNIGTEKTDEKMSVAITNVGTAGPALDLTATASTQDVLVDNKWQTQIKGYYARNVSLQNTLNLTSSPFLYLADTFRSDAGITINGANVNVMPSIMTLAGGSSFAVRYGDVYNLLTLEFADHPASKIAVYYDGEKTSVFVDGRKVISDGVKTYIATAVEYFNFRYADKLDAFKLFIGDTFTDQEIEELTKPNVNTEV